MKFKIFLFSLLILFLIASAIPGYATTSDSAAVGLTVIHPFSVTIISPTSQTYDATIIDLTYVVNGTESWCGYSLNAETNVTLSGNTSIIALDGSNNLIIYCNDTFAIFYNDSVLFDVSTRRGWGGTRFGLPEESEEIPAEEEPEEEVKEDPEFEETEDILREIERVIDMAESLIFITPEIKTLLEQAREEMYMTDYSQALTHAAEALDLTRFSVATCTGMNILLTIILIMLIVYLYNIKRRVNRLELMLHSIKNRMTKKKK